MADIARLAGVSVSAVSRALRGSPEIGEETRKRIVELAKSLNYSVNAGAANLRLKQNKTVAVVMPYLHNRRHQLADPFFISLISSIANALSDRGFDTLLCRVNESHTNFADPYFTGRALGLIFTGHWLPHDRLNELAMSKVPFTIWGERIERQLYCTVGGDNRQGGRLATQHLLAQGCKRIAIIGSLAAHEIRNRHEGYLMALHEAGISPDPALQVESQWEPDALERNVEALLLSGTPFDGVFACSDLAAMTVVNVLIRHGMRVPEQVAVVGYDDIELASYFRPALTTIRQPVDAAGTALVDALIDQIEGGEPIPRWLATELIQRESSRRPAL